MNASPTALEFHGVIFAHHYGYRPVAVSEAIPKGVVETLEASKHHLYFFERRKDEKFRPIKYRFFRLAAENETFAVWAKLEAVEDATTHRGLVSMAQFYLLGGEQIEKFERALQANAAYVMAKIPFLTIQPGSALRRDERRTLARLKLALLAPEPVANSMRRLRETAGPEHVQRLFSEEVIEGLDAGKQIFFYSAGFSDFTSIFNLHCRSFFTALPEAYRRSLSLATAESTTAVEEYDIVFLHSGAEIGAGKTREDVKLVSLDGPATKSPVLWYLRDEPRQTEAHDFVSQRLARKNLPALNALQDYFQNQRETGAALRTLLEKIEPHLSDLRGSAVVADLCDAIKPGDEHLAPEIFESLQRAKIVGGKLEQEQRAPLIQYIVAWLEFWAETSAHEMVRAWIAETEKAATKEPFACEVFAEAAKSKKLRQLFPSQLVFTSGPDLKTNEQDPVGAAVDDAGKIYEELLINLKLKPAGSRRLKIDGYSLSLCAPEFERHFDQLSENQQKAFFEKLCVFAKDAGKLEGILLPVLCTYLKNAPKTTAVSDGGFDELVRYLSDKLGSCWKDYQIEKKTLQLCDDLKNIPLAPNETENASPAPARGGKLKTLNYKTCFVQILLATQNRPERVRKLISETVLAARLSRDAFTEIVQLVLAHVFDKTEAEREQIATLWHATVEHY